MALACLLAFALPATAADYQRGATVRVAQIYLSPDTSSAKLAEMDRGREIIVLETSREWAHVEANLTEERTVTGWVLDKGVIRASTPNGDRILFGEAVDSEDQASRRHGRNGAAQDAMRLYYCVAEYFPTSPLAAKPCTAPPTSAGNLKNRTSPPALLPANERPTCAKAWKRST